MPFSRAWCVIKQLSQAPAAAAPAAQAQVALRALPHTDVKMILM